MTRIYTAEEVEAMTPAQFAAFEAERMREKYFADGTGILERLRRPPGPGYRPEEVERAVERRREREAAVAAERERQREQAAQARTARQDAYAQLVAFRGALQTRTGTARNALTVATEALDLDAAVAAATDVVSLERVADALKQFEHRTANMNLFAGPVPSAEVV